MNSKKSRHRNTDPTPKDTNQNTASNNNDYAAFEPMKQAAASTAEDGGEPTRLMLSVLMLFAAASAGFLIVSGYSISAILYNALQSLPAGLLAVFAQAQPGFKWRLKYWTAARGALFLLSMAMLSPIQFATQTLVISVAICGGILLCGYSVEHIYRKHKGSL